MADLYSFDLNSMFISAVYATNLTVTVTASYAGEPFYSTEISLSTAAPRQPVQFPPDMQGPVSLAAGGVPSFAQSVCTVGILSMDTHQMAWLC